MGRSRRFDGRLVQPRVNPEGAGAPDVGDRPSLARSSVARLLSDGAALILGLIGGVITARLLGPAGKGAYASLIFLLGVFSQITTLGLGDAAVILIGQKKVSLQQATSASLPVVIATSLLGAVLLAAVAGFAIGARGPTLGESVLVLAFTVPIRACVNALTFLVNANEKIVATSIIRTIGNFVTVVAVVVLVVIFPLNITGAVLAVLAASAVELGLIVFMLARMGIPLRPIWDRDYLAGAVRLGPAIQVAYLVVTLAARIDVLVVYWLAGRSQAGHYSVALTFGQLVIYVSFSLAFAAYPRLAHVEASEAGWLAAKISRIGLAASIVAGCLLLLFIPVALPTFFGDAYRPSVAPALVLVAGGLLWSELWLLCRSAVARGNTALQLKAFGATLVAMVGLDLALVPVMGIMGAAVASLIGPAVGLFICLRAYSRSAFGDLSLSDLFPRGRDFRELGEFLVTLPGRAVGSLKRT